MLREEDYPAPDDVLCESAACPNRGECWDRGTATFMILGNVCTRTCGFCNVRSGRAGPLDPDEPQSVAQAVLEMGLKYAVLTSVNRDDLTDGGAGHWVATISAIRRLQPDSSVHVLTPDFDGNVA